MRKLFDFCICYDIEVMISYNHIANCVELKFYKRKTSNVYMLSVPMSDFVSDYSADIEEVIINKVIEDMKLDEREQGFVKW